MGNCLVTTLQEAVSNTDLYKIGEIRFKVYGNASINVNALVVASTTDTFVVNSAQEINITPGGVNIQTTTPNSVVSVADKYAITSIQLNFNGYPLNPDGFSYCESLDAIRIVNVIDDVDFTSWFEGLSRLNLVAIGRTGSTENTIKGNISCFRDVTSLTEIDISHSNNVFGDISSFSNLVNLTKLTCTSPKLTGNIESLHNLSSCEVINFASNTNIVGDLSQLPSGVIYLASSGTFTWPSTTSRPASSSIFSIGQSGIHMESSQDVDNMLINLSNCTFIKFYGSAKTLRVFGTRTSASDAAVSKLTNMGYTIDVRP